MILFGILMAVLAFAFFPVKFAAGLVIGMLLANWHRLGNPFGC